MREIGHVLRQCGREVVGRVPDPQVSVGADVRSQCGSGPAVMGGLCGVPGAGGGGGESVEEHGDVAPGQLRNGSLRNWLGEFGCEGSHVDEVALGEAAHAGECGAQVVGEAGGDLGAPSLSRLSLAGGVADLPIQHDEFGVDSARGLYAGVAYLCLDLLEQFAVSGWFDLIVSCAHRFSSSHVKDLTLLALI